MLPHERKKAKKKRTRNTCVSHEENPFPQSGILMFLLHRRLPSLARATFLCNSMDPAATAASSSFGGSSRLAALAQQLRRYKPPPPSSFDGAEEMQADQETAGKVVSQVGFQESMASILKDPERFRPKRAAVLICIFEGDDGDLRVILTKRSSRLSTHSGEVSLPGGKAEEDDVDDGMTATREAEEEIGLDPSLVDVVTSLEPFLSKHLLRVIPVIGILRDKKTFIPTPNPAEVEAVFDVPLEMFLKDENRRSEEREWMGEKYLIHYFDYKTGDEDYMIWGLTAGILIRAASVTYQRPPAFVEQCPKFKYPKMKINKKTITIHTTDPVPVNEELGYLLVYIYADAEAEAPDSLQVPMNLPFMRRLLDGVSVSSRSREELAGYGSRQTSPSIVDLENNSDSPSKAHFPL